MTLDASIFDNLRSELRRGSLILAVLAQLRTEQYGYTLRKALADHGMEIEESTLYPLLRRLDTQALRGHGGRRPPRPEHDEREHFAVRPWSNWFLRGVQIPEVAHRRWARTD